MTKKDIYVLVAFLIGLLLMVSVYRTYGEQIQLQWDAVDGVDGYMLYQSQKDSTFHYDTPVVTEAYPDGKIPPDVTHLDVDLPGIEGRNTRYRFVARSFRGDDQSEDSNEVEYYVALVPPPVAVKLTGSYNRDGGSVNIAWEQPVEDYDYLTVSHWIVYYRITGAEEWVPIGRINSDHVLEMTAPFDAVPNGEQSSVDFVIVSYRRSGVYSANSEVLTLDINRKEVPSIQNLRINIQIPVE